MHKLIKGIAQFRAKSTPEQKARYAALALGQKPDALFVCCSDSRVAVNAFASTDPGDLFVVRNVANLVPPYEQEGKYHGVSAALEFGVGVLKVKHIVVLGHAQCGGVQAYAEDADPISPGDFIGRWMSLMAPAAEKVGPRGEMSRGEFLARMEKASVVNTLDNLMTFPRLRKLIERGTVALHGAYFGVAKGELSVLDRATGEFRPVGR